MGKVERGSVCVSLPGDCQRISTGVAHFQPFGDEVPAQTAGEAEGVSWEAEGPGACSYCLGFLSRCGNVCEEAGCLETSECVQGRWCRQAQVYVWAGVRFFLALTWQCVSGSHC